MAKKEQTIKATPLTEEQLFEKERLLNEREQKLNSDIAEFESFQENVFKTKEELAKERESLEAEKKDHAEAVELFTKEKEKFETMKSEFEAAQSTEDINNDVEKSALSFIYENEEYSFSDEAPENILFDGVSYTQQEIVDNEDVLIQILGSNSNLIIKL